MRVLAISFALSHELKVTCDAPLAATAPFRRRPEQEVNAVKETDQIWRLTISLKHRAAAMAVRPAQCRMTAVRQT
jgi:hypothetical protein